MREGLRVGGTARGRDDAVALATLAQWDALRAVDRSPGTSAREPAAATFQGEQAFGTLVERLVAQGPVERRPGHGRRIRHHLTADGERTLAAGHGVVGEVLADCFTGLQAEERATLLELLGRLNAQE
ncbi:MarR family winged helix-turn-helix transcriptional regulator [Streptomyces sp. NPDC090493]|uniref:MarR family winged helix-turn-helix transcriptional regulator n=1 Tax=Streptomyces sp. NPDC090493 TaxID=3365964 RepID=UPI0038306AF3